MVVQIKQNYGFYLIVASVLLSMGISGSAVIYVEETERSCILESTNSNQILSLGTAIIYLSIVSLASAMYMILFHMA